jgi:signal transduction histidine kinase
VTAAAAPRRALALGRSSLVGRLIWSALAWSLLVLVGSGIALTTFFRSAALDRFDRDLYEVTQGLYAGTTIEDNEVVAPALTDARAVRVYSGSYWQLAEIQPSGRLNALVRSRSLWDTVLQGPADGAGRLVTGSTLYYDVRGPLNAPLRATARTVKILGRAAPVVIMAAEDRSPIDRDSRRFAVRIAIALVVLGAGLIAGIVLQVRFGLQPLFALSREVANIRGGRAERVVGDYPTELAPLATELNGLLAHNEEVVDRQRTHVGNLAHALKTPLSVMLAEAERDPGALAAVVTRQAETMKHQVDHHLRRARAAARAQGPGERTAVDEVLDELARTLERIFRPQGVVIDWDCDEALCFHGERQDLLEIAGNVMENACKWSRGKVRVAAVATDPLTWRLTVEDNGPGLPAEGREEVLKRGARLDESAPGSGLGLSIVDELARAYGGSVALDASAMGGLKVEVTLPRVVT